MMRFYKAVLVMFRVRKIHLSRFLFYLVVLCTLLLLFSCFLFSNRLPGGGITFFAAAKKVIKESSFSTTHKAHFR
jgi:hypothetical protein